MTKYLFGFWTALYMLWPSLAFQDSTVRPPDPISSTFHIDPVSVFYEAIVGLVAVACWANFHREGRHIGWSSYLGLACIVVAISHLAAFGAFAVYGAAELWPRNWIFNALLAVPFFLWHAMGCLVPALVGTALFVLAVTSVDRSRWR